MKFTQQDFGIKGRVKMANEYINREKLLKKINEYKNVTIWNTEELDAETIPGF